MKEIDQLAQKAKDEGVSLHLIFKEEMHLLVLDYLFKEGAFSHLVFQGGTALRIIYQGVRYSEDLDFVLREKRSSFFKQLPKVLKGLPSFLDKLIPASKRIGLKVQKESAQLTRCTLVVETEGLSAADKTHIEVARIPSYENEIVMVRRGDLAVSPAVRVESAREILSDKICALGARKYLKGRDLWDLHFLLQTMKIPLDDPVKQMVLKKVSDYGFTRDGFFEGFRRRLTALVRDGASILDAEMRRFLPASYRNLFKDSYPEMMRFIGGALKKFDAEIA